MPIPVYVTTAGRAALINAESTGTLPVIIAEAGVSATAVTPSEAATTLPDEIKRLSTIAGEVVAADTIHVSVIDQSNDAYTLRSLALYLDDGTLFAIAGQADPILEKAAPSIAAVAFDIVLADIAATSIAFGDASFSNPAATTERQGVVELATDAEVAAGTDPVRVVTPAGAAAAFVKKAGDTMTGQLVLPGDPTAAGHAVRKAYADALTTAAAIIAKLLTVDGSGSGLDADMLDGHDAAEFLLATWFQLTGDGASGSARFGTFKLTWKTTTISGAATSTQMVTYGAGVEYSTWARAWVEGDDAQADVSLLVTNHGLTGATVRKGTDNDCPLVLFAIGI